MPHTGAIRAGRAFVELFADDSALVHGLKRAQYKLRRFGADVRRIGAGFLGLGGALAVPMGMAIKAAGNAMETINKFEAVFRDQAGAAGDFADALAESVGRSRYEIRDALSSLQAFFIGLGFGAEEARKMSQAVEEMSIDFASFYNLQDTEAMDKFLSGLSGMSRPLREYGINLLDSAVQEEMLAMGMRKVGKEWTQQQKVLARYNIMLRAMTEQGAMGDAVRTAGSFQNRMKALRSQIHDTAVEIGNALLPAATRVVERILEVIRGVSRWVKANKEAVMTIARIAGAITIGGGLLVALGAVAAAISALLNPMGVLIGGLAFLAGASGFAALTRPAEKTSQYIRAQAKEAGKLLDRYKELVEKTKRTADEETELLELTRRLKEEFPQYADAIDGTADSLHRLIQEMGGLVKLQYTDELRKQRKLFQQQARQYEEYRSFVDKLKKAAKTDTVPDLLTLFRLGREALGGGILDPEIVKRKLDEAEKRMQATRGRIIELQRLLRGEIEEPRGPEEPAAGGIGEAMKTTKDLCYRLAELRLEALEDEHMRALALVQLRYNREVAEAREAGKNIALIEKAREQEIANLHSDYLRRRAEEEKKAEDEKAAYMRRIEEEIAEEYIRLTTKGLTQQLALLAREKERAIREALEAGLGFDALAAIERLFGLRAQALRAAAEAPQTMVRGTFAATAVWGLDTGNAMDRTARATEETAKNTRRMLEMNLAFS